jgi:membrane protein YdbS with pleckstrin-like domain
MNTVEKGVRNLLPERPGGCFAQKVPDPFFCAVEAPPVVEMTPVASAKTAAKLEMLGGDEVIQLSIKPSLWFIPLVSLGWLLGVSVLVVALAAGVRGSWAREGLFACQALVGIAALRLAVATLQWASRLYVLTNRRVMRFTGVLSVRVAECPLARISALDLHASPYGRLLRLGTIRMQPVDRNQPPVSWDDVAHPQEIHEILERAIRKSQM